MKDAKSNRALSPKQREELFRALEARFEKNVHRHRGLAWEKVAARLESNPGKLWSLHQMEISGGEPDVVRHDKETGEVIFLTVQQKLRKAGSRFVTTGKGWNRGKNTSPKTPPRRWISSC